MADLAARERPDFDERGFPARHGEVLSVDLSREDVKRARGMGFDVIEDVRLAALDVRMVRLRAPEGMSAAQAVTILRGDAAAEKYDFDHYYGVSGEQASANDHRPIKLPANHKTLPMAIGMIDTGVASHPSLRGVSVEAQNFSTATATPVAKPTAAATHGTAVASILVQNGAAHLVSANIFSDDPRPFAAADGIARAVDWMVGRGVPVINISIAGPSNRMIDRVIAAATAKGHLIVAAAGNGGPAALPAYPAASPGAIAVTAVDAQGRVYAHANQGNYVAIAALGVGVPAAAADGTIRSFNGTSFASPVVAAHLAGCVGKASPRRAQSCVSRMESSARDLGAAGRDPVYGFGMLKP